MRISSVTIDEMPWQLLIISSVLLYSVSVLLQKVILKNDDNDPVAFAIIFQSLIGAVILGVGFATKNIDFSSVVKLWPQLLLMTIFYGFGNIILFKALKGLEASIYTVLFSLRGLFTILSSAIFLSEKLSILQLLGASLILISVVIVQGKNLHFKLSKYEAFVILAAVLAGIGNTNDRSLLSSLNIYSYVSLAFILPAVCIAVCYPKQIIATKKFLKPVTFSKLLTLCVIYALSSMLFFQALKVAPVSSQVTSINLTNVVVVVMLAIVFLKERKDLWFKLAGAVVSMIGLLLLT